MELVEANYGVETRNKKREQYNGVEGFTGSNHEIAGSRETNTNMQIEQPCLLGRCSFVSTRERRDRCDMELGRFKECDRGSDSDGRSPAKRMGRNGSKDLTETERERFGSRRAKHDSIQLADVEYKGDEKRHMGESSVNDGCNIFLRAGGCVQLGKRDFGSGFGMDNFSGAGRHHLRISTAANARAMAMVVPDWVVPTIVRVQARGRVAWIDVKWDGRRIRFATAHIPHSGLSEEDFGAALELVKIY